MTPCKKNNLCVIRLWHDRFGTNFKRVHLWYTFLMNVCFSKGMITFDEAKLQGDVLPAGYSYILIRKIALWISLGNRQLLKQMPRQAVFSSAKNCRGNICTVENFFKQFWKMKRRNEKLYRSSNDIIVDSRYCTLFST